MEISLTEQEAADLARATSSARQVRQWRRYRAIQLLAEDPSPQQVATVLGCSLASVYNWAAAWQQQGQTGLSEPKHAGRTCILDTEALRLLEQWLSTDPQTHGDLATGWAVPLLHTHLAQAGYPVSQRTLRRACIVWAGAGSAPSMSWGGLTRPTKKKKGAGCPRPAGVSRGEGGLDRRRNDTAGVSAAPLRLGQTGRAASRHHQRT